MSFALLITFFLVLTVLLGLDWLVTNKLKVGLLANRPLAFRVLWIFLFVLSLSILVATKGQTSYTLVLFCLIAFIFIDKRTEESPISYSFLEYGRALLFGMVAFVLVLLIKTGGKFDPESVAYFVDHYYYTKIGDTLLATGIESYNFGASHAGVIDAKFYHYMELYFGELVSRSSGVPSIMVFQYVTTPLLMWLSWLAVSELSKTQRWYHDLITLLVILFFPSIVTSIESLAISGIGLREPKLLVVLMFTTHLVISLFRNRIKESCFFSVLLILIYPTTLFACAGGLFALMVYALVKGFRKDAIWALAGLLIVGVFFVLVQKFEVTKSGQKLLDFSLLGAYAKELVRLIRVYGVSSAVHYGIHATLALLLIWRIGKRDRNWSHLAFLVVSIGASFLGATLLLGTPDGTQAIINFLQPMMIAYLLYILLTTEKSILRNGIIAGAVVFIGTFIVTKEVPRLPDSQIELAHNLNVEPGEIIGSFQDLENYNSKHLSNTNVNNVGKELQNIKNFKLMNVNPVEPLMYDSSLDAATRFRLNLDEYYQYQKHGKHSKQEVLKDKVPYILSTSALESIPLFEAYERVDTLEVVSGLSAEIKVEYKTCLLYKRKS